MSQTLVTHDPDSIFPESELSHTVYVKKKTATKHTHDRERTCHKCFPE